eukprot:scaffold10994_cov70-Cylindrotheca_fusiformis.AAC.1
MPECVGILSKSLSPSTDARIIGKQIAASSSRCESFFRFDAPIHPSNKPHGSQGTDRTSNQHDTKANQGNVTKIEEIGKGAVLSFQSSEPIATVEKGVQATDTWTKEGNPPPAIVLSTQLKVHKKDGQFA